jgi:hypothetical protein
LYKKNNVIGDFTPWEQSLLIAKVCKFVQHNPENLNWNNIGCITDKKNLYLDILKEINHGKTI